jgi:hypothetical protein
VISICLVGNHKFCTALMSRSHATTLLIRLPVEMRRELDGLAATRYTSANQYAKRLIAEHLLHVCGSLEHLELNQGHG